MKGLVGHHLHHLGGVDTEGAEVVVDVGAAQEADSVCGVAPGLAEHLSLHIFVQVCVDLGLGGGYGCWIKDIGVIRQEWKEACLSICNMKTVVTKSKS